MIRNKNMAITFGITMILFIFIAALVYVLYCYSYYDDYQKELYANEFNSRYYDFIYDNLSDKDKLDKEDFNKVIDLMYNKNTLNNIYNTYYINSSLYKDNSTFINEYYYGDIKVDTLDIEFLQKGKSTIFSRSKFYYKKINLNNSVDSSALGIIDNVVLDVENNSTLKIDGKDIFCDDGKCLINYMFMGLHEINYESNGYSYYGILNVTSNVRDINITVLNSLVRINNNEEFIDLDNIKEVNLLRGTYKVNQCFLESVDCPYKKTSYLKLHDNGTAELYIYVTYDQAGDTFVGTYEINNGILVLKFDKHTYDFFDFDTKVTTREEIESEMEIRFRIDDEKNIINDDYSFRYSE